MACKGESRIKDGDDAAPVTGLPVDSAPLRAPECGSFLNRQDLGPVSLNAEGLSEPFTFDIPDCALAFMLQIEGPDDVAMILDRLVSPSGEVWIEGPLPLGQLTSPVRMVQGEGVGTALVSNSDQPFEPGTFEAVIYGATVSGGLIPNLTPYVGTVDVEVLWKGPDTLAQGGAVDINLFLTGAGGLTASSAPSSPLFQDMLAAFTDIYAEGAVGIGEIRYFDVDAQFRTITSITGPDNMLSEMFTASAAAPNGLNFFFVDRFEIFGALAGVSGGVPGPAAKAGSPRSGVAVALSSGALPGGGIDTDVLAHVMAHEGGHYLGLFHTTEFLGLNDPLADTPEGLSETSNLMYPTVGGDTAITPQQSRVMHHHLEVTLERAP